MILKKLNIIVDKKGGKLSFYIVVFKNEFSVDNKTSLIKGIRSRIEKKKNKNEPWHAINSWKILLLFLKKVVRMLTRLRTITRDSHLCCANTSEDQSKRHYSKYTTIGRVLRLDHTTITETATSRRRAASPAPAAIAVVVSKEPESVDEDWSVPPVAAAVDKDSRK